MNQIKFVLVLFIFSVSIKVQAQNNSSIGVGAEIGLPSGNFTSLSGIGLGASLKANLPISQSFAITLNGGIMNFFGKRNQIINIKDLTYLPAKAGLKYQLGEGFYAEGQIGAGLPLNEGQKALFIWSPGIGNIFRIGGKNKLDLGIRYESWMGKNDNQIILNRTSSKGFVGIRFAYLFGL
ncbi:hypothetical protein DHW03_00405 [Pedobacter yonginense]|uniref:Outer membrane protein beta-barrel domain-containing protein n=1 Tax=Pedobacter yonginense TaxID=651869 RepID=A0A317EP21_9SPHI|nr:hypothetical protein [Pedobacter yonginense]PWS28354.1 hypothetical protein DHW03_00405 [Pedobacter yonginense]